MLSNPSVGGLVAANITTLTTTSTIPTSALGGTVVLNAAGATTQTLPAASTVAAGKRFEFFNINEGISAVTRASADTIQVNATTVTSLGLKAGDTLTLESDGTSRWYAVGGTVQLKYATAFLSGAGYEYLPSGKLRQWGTGSTTNTGSIHSFNIPFPTAVDSIVACHYQSPIGIAAINAIATNFRSNSQFDVGSSISAGASFFWQAIGS